MSKREDKKIWGLVFRLLSGGYTVEKSESYYYALVELRKWNLEREKNKNDNTKTRS